MQHTHDHAYKLLFSEPELIIDLLQGFVDEPWVADLDFTTLEPVSASYITDDLRSRESDVIWRVKHREQWLYVYLLLEFQSTIDHYMAVRLMVYLGLLYQDLIKTKKVLPDKRLPPVIPIVLYNGDSRWNAPVEVADLIAPIPVWSTYRPSLKYLLLDEGAYDLATLDSLKNLVAAIFRLEHHKEPEALLEVIRNLLEWLSAPTQARLRRSFSVWVNRVLKLPAHDRHIEPIDLAEIKTMLSDRIPQWIKEGTAQGRAEGRAQGKAEGLIEGELKGEIQVLLKLLRLKFGVLPDPIEHTVTTADKASLDHWIEQVLIAKQLDDLFGQH